MQMQINTHPAYMLLQIHLLRFFATLIFTPISYCPCKSITSLHIIPLKTNKTIIQELKTTRKMVNAHFGIPEQTPCLLSLTHFFVILLVSYSALFSIVTSKKKNQKKNATFYCPLESNRDNNTKFPHN